MNDEDDGHCWVCGTRGRCATPIEEQRRASLVAAGMSIEDATALVSLEGMTPQGDDDA